MTIGFRAAAQVFNTSGSATSLVVPMPAGLVVGDRVVVHVGWGASSPTFTDPAGWIKLGERLTGTQLKGAVYYRDVDGTEAGTYTWTSSNAGRCDGYALAYSGCDLTVAPSAVAADGLNAAAVTSATQVVGDGDYLVSFAAGRESPGTDTAKTWTTSDGSDVERFDLYSSLTGTAAKYTAAAYDSARSLTAGSVSRTLTCTVALSQIQAWSVRLAAPPPPPPVSVPNPWSWCGMPQRP